jgi:phage shock protein PspC (stress-responsive transcriptional regulator)
MSEQPGTSQATAAPPPPPPGDGGHTKRLYRRTDTKMIAGVAAGIADYFEVDPMLVRIAFVIAAFVGGVGVVAYGVAWILVPPSQEVSSPGEDVVRRLKAAPSWVAIALVAGGAVLLVNATGVISAPVGWGLTLVVVGVLLFRHASREPGPAPISGSPTLPGSPPPSPAAFAATSAATTAPTGAPPGVTPGLPAPPTVPPAPPGPEPPAPMWIPPSGPRRVRRHRPPRDRGLFWGTIGVALLVVGVAALLANAGVIDLALAAYLALALAVLGLGLLVGTWWGRSRGLIVLALVLTPFVLLGSLVNVPIHGGVGDRFYGPRAVADVPPVYQQVAGRMVVDLTRLQLGDGPVHVEASMVAGKIEVILPTGVHAAVHAEAGAGELQVLGNQADGLNLDILRSTGPSTGGVVDLHLRVSFGTIVVFRYRTSGG